MAVFTRHETALRRGISLLFLGIIGWFIYHHWEEFAVITEIGKWDFALITALFVLNRFFNAAHFAMLYRAVGARVGIWESFGITAVSATLNTTLPAQAGGVARAVYLKQKHAVPYSFVPTLFVSSVIFSLTVGALLLLLANLTLYWQGIRVPAVLWIISAGATVSAIIFKLDLPEQLHARLGRIGNILGRAAQGWNQLKNNKSYLLKAGIFQALTYISFGLGLTAIYRSMGFPVDLVLATSIAIVISLSNLIIVTPGNLGSQEAVIGYLSLISGSTFAYGVAVSAIIRVTLLVINLVVAPVAWYALFSRGPVNLSWSSLKEKQSNGEASAMKK